MIDVDRVRADTPGCERVVHFNNAGAALPPAIVTDTVIAYLRREAEIGGYEAAAEVADDIELVYSEVAAFCGADVAEIALVESATRAWTTAFGALVFQPDDRILTHRVEYASNFMPMLVAARRTGATIELVPSTPTGEIDVDALDTMLDERVRLVALTHVPSHSGLVNPAAAVGARTRAAGVPFFLDACQSLGQLPVDVEAIGCDVLGATGRKFLRGPRGTGFLYVRGSYLDRLEPTTPDLRGADWLGADTFEPRADARRFEQFERSIANVLGLGAAVEYARELTIAEITARLTELHTHLRENLRTIPGVELRDEGAQQCAIVTFTVVGCTPAAVVETLHAAGVNTWIASASSARLDFDARGIEAVVRASPHYYNTFAEIDRMTDLVAPLVAP